MTYYDRVTGPFRARKGSHKDEYELRLWAGSTHVGSKHFTVKDEALAAKKTIEGVIAKRQSEAPVEPRSPMEAARELDFWLLDLWECFRNCKTKEQAEVLKAKSHAMQQAQRAMLLVGGTAEPTIPELKQIPQEELEKKLKVVNGGTGS